jgi:hypothetical protein
MPTFNLVPMSSGTVTGKAWIEPNLVISQVVADTYTMVGDGSMNDVEYIELFNPTTAPIYIGTTRDTYYSAKPALWITSENGDIGYEYDCTSYHGDYRIFCMNYVTSYVPAQSYFLISNADRFMLNGVWVTADAYYTPLYTTHHLSANNQSVPAFMGGGNYAVNVTKAGTVSLYNFLGWSNVPQFSVIDQVRWNSATGSAFGYNGQIISTNTIPACPVASCPGYASLGSPAGNQLVRLSSPSFTSDVVNYGRAYDSQNPQWDFLYPKSGFPGLVYMPRDVASGSFTVISGMPAVGAVVSSNDGLSDPAQAYLAGLPPSAQFVLNSIATATMPSPWTVLVTSGGFTLENDTVTIPAQGSVYNFPSSTTILNQTATQGFISGTVTDIVGNPITAPSLIQVNPGVNGAPQNANGSTGNYMLRVTSGSVDVVVNPNYLNNNYVSASSLSVTVALGQVSNGVNFILSQGGQISGFVTRDGVNALPGVTVTAFDANGYARDSRVTDNNGRFTTLTIATGTYSVAPELDSLENSSPVSTPVTVAGGSTVFSTTFTISGALGTVSGSVTAGGKTISTGVLVVVTTSTLAGSPPAPPTLSSTTLAANSYYIASSKEDGTYSVDVRQSTSPAYKIYAYYSTLSSTGAVTIQSQTLSNVQVLAGSSVTGNNFAW